MELTSAVVVHMVHDVIFSTTKISPFQSVCVCVFVSNYFKRIKKKTSKIFNGWLKVLWKVRTNNKSLSVTPDVFVPIFFIFGFCFVCVFFFARFSFRVLYAPSVIWNCVNGMLMSILLWFAVSKDRDSNDSVSGSGLRFRNQSPSTTNRRSRDRERSTNDKTWERDADANTMLITNEASITSPAVAGNSATTAVANTVLVGSEQSDTMDDSRLSGIWHFSSSYMFFLWLMKNIGRWFHSAGDINFKTSRCLWGNFCWDCWTANVRWINDSCFVHSQRSSAINRLYLMNWRGTHRQWSDDTTTTIIIIDRIAARQWIASIRRSHAHVNQYEKNKRLVMKMWTSTWN